MSQATKPALLGGDPVRTRPLAPQQTLGPEERAAVLEVLDSGVLSQFLGEPGPDFYGGPQVRRTEAAYAAHFRARFAVTTNSATTALHVAVAACGLGPGDEVIVSPFTMSASATSILMQNAIPVFADIDPETFCLDPVSVRTRLTPHTKGIMAVDIFGQPAHWDALRAIAKEHGLRLIEDAAQAAHAAAGGRFAGTLADAGVLSLNYHKIIHSGEGGVLLTDDPEIARRAQLVRNHGEAVVEESGPADIANTFGSNYRMTEIEAGIARAQLAKLPGLFAHRAALAAHLTRKLQGFPGIVPPHVEPGVTSAYYVFAVRVTPDLELGRSTVARALTAEGIPFGEGYVRPLYLQPLYQRRIAYGGAGCPWTCGHYRGQVSYAPGICPVAERMHAQELMLAAICHAPQTLADMDDVARAFEKIVEHRGALAALERQGARP